VAVGLKLGAARVSLSADSGATLLDASGSPLLSIDPGASFVASASGPTIRLETPSGFRSEALSGATLVARPAGLLLVDGNPYRGRITLLRDRTGLTIVNQVRMEHYLAGVVSAEMGKREPDDLEALAAQAVVSRTFALRNLGKRRSDGFDLFATVVDQVYGGVNAETPLAWQAVQETVGRIVAYNGYPIDAFFYSTCAGRTAKGTEVFAAADRPYLRSVSDLDGNGQAYCRLSPRFRWHEEWTAEQLKGILQRSLPAALGRTAPAVGDVRYVRIVERTASDRVSRLAIGLGGTEVHVDGPLVRQVLRPPADPLLRSSAFTLTAIERDGRLERLIAEGQGAGHGVGFCQWGAVGRSRAGQTFGDILRAYFPGTSLERLY
jgi:stage II sporulation protein D